MLNRASGRKKLGELLVEMGLIQETELDQLVRRAEHTGSPLGQFLVNEGVINDVDLAKALATQSEIPFHDLSKHLIPADVLSALPEDLIRQHKILPVGREGGALVLVVEDPKIILQNDVVRTLLPTPFRIRFGARSQIEKAIDRLFGTQRKTVESIAKYLAQNPDGAVGAGGGVSIGAVYGQVTIDSLLEKLFEMAMRNDSSDIHVDMADGFIRIRERIDGVLQETSDLDAGIHQSLISKLKVLGGLDITEKRKPQDGRFRFKVGNRVVDVRLSTLPTIRGERAVLRILDKSKFKVKIDDIGINPEMAATIKELLNRPHGILLVTGPTGSGKTTTVYAMLTHINEAESNIITVEDPVEYQFDIINQVQINPKAGLNFADLLRNILRQDPDVIMVGEIRDKETADTAIRAALTGHLVISTIHTNDSVSTVHRLMDMGVEPFLIGSSVLAILSQRLVRLLCKFCRKEESITEEVLKALPPRLGHADWIGRKWYKPVGCEECRNTGYRGRSAIAELFVPDEEMRKAITDQVSRTEIIRYIEKQGFQSMRQEAMSRVWSGDTSIDEIIRNTI
jgi:type IV pilus assembly protein PilB